MIPAEASWHGTVNGYNNKKCRCADCRAAWAERIRSLKARRAATVKDRNDPRHGTHTFYQNHGCRCERCTAAHAIYMRNIPSKRKKAA